MKIALVVPGGVDRSGEYRVIPVFVWLIGRLARAHEVHVFTRRQEPEPGSWPLAGAIVHNSGGGARRLVHDLIGEHRRAPFHLVQSLFGGADALLAMVAARWLRLPMAVHLAGGEPVALRDIGYGGRRNWRGRMLLRLLLRNADAVTAASAPMIDAVAALGHQAQRLPLGVDLDLWPARPPRARESRQPLRLVHVASLNAVKDQRTLLLALADVAESGCEFELDMIGEDTLSGQVQRLAQSLGLGERVRFRGFQTQSALREIVARAHLHLVSSRHEAGPIALIEAALAGVPTVGTRVGHLAEWQPSAAWAVPVGDAQALAAGILALYHDDSRRLALARAAQQRALAEDAAFTAREFEQLYAKLRGGSGREARAPMREPARDAGTVPVQGGDDALPPARQGQVPGDAPGDVGRLPAP